MSQGPKKYGISVVAKCETFLINVVEDVKKGARIEQQENTYMAWFVPEGKQPLIIQRFNHEGAVPTMASEQLREDFLRRRRTGDLLPVGIPPASTSMQLAPQQPQSAALPPVAIPAADTALPQDDDLGGLEVVDGA